MMIPTTAIIALVQPLRYHKSRSLALSMFVIFSPYDSDFLEKLRMVMSEGPRPPHNKALWKAEDRVAAVI